MNLAYSFVLNLKSGVSECQGTDPERKLGLLLPDIFCGHKIGLLIPSYQISIEHS